MRGVIEGGIPATSHSGRVCALSLDVAQFLAVCVNRTLPGNGSGQAQVQGTEEKYDPSWAVHGGGSGIGPGA